MKDFSEVQDFINAVSEFEFYQSFKEKFIPMYETMLQQKTMWVEYSSLIRGISYDLEKATLFVTFVSEKSYAYYNVPIDVFVLGAFTDYLNEIDKAGDLPTDFDSDNMSMGKWFNEMVKGYFDYTLIN